MSAPEQILVIKHGALGDLILATAPMQAIRDAHPRSHIVLLTTRPYAEMMAASPYVDDVWVDVRPKAWHLFAMRRLAKQLNSRRFARVYDLQTSGRSSRYFKLFRAPRPEWSGIAAGASHRHNTTHRTSMHTIERQKEQLAIAGIAHVPAVNVDWMQADISAISLPLPYVIVVAGGSAHRPQKRWPLPHYVQAAQELVKKGYTPVLIGTGAEAELLSQIAKQVPEAVNLCNQTGFEQLAQLARGAAFAIGNDTGPMHIIAAAGCRSVVLFSSASNPDLCAPRGEHVTILREADLQMLEPSRVLAAAKA